MSLSHSHNAEATLTDTENRTIKKREAQEVSNNAMAEFLAKGGKIQQIGRGISSQTDGSPHSAWGAPRKAGRPLADVTASIAVLDK
jgi:hypothetical protein